MFLLVFSFLFYNFVRISAKNLLTQLSRAVLLFFFAFPFLFSGSFVSWQRMCQRARHAHSFTFSVLPSRFSLSVSLPPCLVPHTQVQCDGPNQVATVCFLIRSKQKLLKPRKAHCMCLRMAQKATRHTCGALIKTNSQSRLSKLVKQ